VPEGIAYIHEVDSDWTTQDSGGCRPQSLAV